MSQNQNQDDNKPKPVFQTNYRCCSSCERRVHKILFKKDGVVCKGCRCPYREGSSEIYGPEE